MKRSDFAASGFDSSSGDGSTEAQAIVIKTEAQLAYLAAQVNGENEYDGKYFKLGGDIDLAGEARAKTFFRSFRFSPCEKGAQGNWFPRYGLVFVTLPSA
jgi:hypothetical protein